MRSAFKSDSPFPLHKGCVLLKHKLPSIIALWYVLLCVVRQRNTGFGVFGWLCTTLDPKFGWLMVNDLAWHEHGPPR
jgi:hypothetical protein